MYLIGLNANPNDLDGKAGFVFVALSGQPKLSKMFFRRPNPASNSIQALPSQPILKSVCCCQGRTPAACATEAGHMDLVAALQAQASLKRASCIHVSCVVRGSTASSRLRRCRHRLVRLR